MEKINLGKHKVASKWEDINLKQWEDYMRLIASQEDDKISMIDTVLAFSDFTREEIMQMPTEVFELVLKHMEFLNQEPKQEPTDKVEINGETYLINYMEKLKVQEYLDVNTVLDSDKYNYALMFAILCRKPDEPYNDDFVAEKINDRIKMYENMPVTQALGLIAFFLTLYLEYQRVSQSYLMVNEIKETALELAKNIKSSLKPMDYITLYKVPQILKLRKLTKSIECI